MTIAPAAHNDILRESGRCNMCHAPASTQRCWGLATYEPETFDFVTFGAVLEHLPIPRASFIALSPGSHRTASSIAKSRRRVGSAHGSRTLPTGSMGWIT